jgi:DNA-directed RNA polymerase specialized sigma24 family protein
MPDSQAKIFEQKLDKLIRLFVFSLTMDKTQSEQISLLNKVGFQPKEIAEIIGTSANTVRVCLSRMKRRVK